jgi:hypothetical protein
MKQSLIGGVVLGVAMAAAPMSAGVAATAGTGGGTITANGKAVTLTLAQAKKEGTGWLVLLSDAVTSFDDPDSYTKVESGKLHSLTLTLGADGKVTYWKMGHNGIDGLFLATSSVTASQAKTGPAAVEGSAKKATDSYGGTAVAFDVTFKAPINKK